MDESYSTILPTPLDKVSGPKGVAPRADIDVNDGRDKIGTISGATGKIEARDAAGRLIGTYTMRTTAVAAVARRQWLQFQEKPRAALVRAPKIPLQKTQQGRKKRQSGGAVNRQQRANQASKSFV